MTSEPVILTPDATVADALARIREPHLSPAIAAQVFVTRAPIDTPTGRYLGAVHFQRLLREPPGDLLGGRAGATTSTRSTRSVPLAEITRRMATYNLVAMAVVDESDRLVGAVTVDDLLDHLLPRDWREQHERPPRPAPRPARLPAAPARHGGLRQLRGEVRAVHGHAEVPGLDDDLRDRVDRS